MLPDFGREILWFRREECRLLGEQRKIELFVGGSNFLVVVMFTNVVSALLFQFGKFLIGMRDQVAKRLEQFVFFSGNGIDDWTKLVFIQIMVSERRM